MHMLVLSLACSLKFDCPEPLLACATGLGELGALVVEVLCDADVAHQRPLLARAQHGGGEDDGVEGHIVLAHELHQLHVLQAETRFCSHGGVESTQKRVVLAQDCTSSKSGGNGISSTLSTELSDRTMLQGMN